MAVHKSYRKFELKDRYQHLKAVATEQKIKVPSFLIML